MNLYVTRTYERAIRKLLPEDARGEMEAPSSPPPRPRRSSGERAVSAICAGPVPTGASAEAIYMLTACAKADRDDLTAADRRAPVRLVTAIERERQG